MLIICDILVTIPILYYSMSCAIYLHYYQYQFQKPMPIIYKSYVAVSCIKRIQHVFNSQVPLSEIHSKWEENVTHHQ